MAGQPDRAAAGWRPDRRTHPGTGGTIAARGHAVEHDGVFILDRIRTGPDHRWRGLATGLISMQRSPAARRVLLASEDGHTLYTSLGWHVLSLYSTLVIPA